MLLSFGDMIAPAIENITWLVTWYHLLHQSTTITSKHYITLSKTLQAKPSQAKSVRECESEKRTA